MAAEQRATADTLARGGHPLRRIELDGLQERSLGGLLMHFMLETIIAAVANDRDAVTRESADLLFHLMILWAATGLRPDDIYAELARREGTSGIAEKDSR